MVDTPVEVAPATPTKTPKAEKAKKTTVEAKDKKVKHPSTMVMVNKAVAALNDRKGSHLSSIKKYIATTYKLDVSKLGTYIRKSLKESVVAGNLVQLSGSGCNGRFKVRAVATIERPVRQKIDKTKVATKKSPVTKKVAKSPSKVKKTKKVPTKKPKTPKPKTVKKAVKSPKKK